MKLLAEGNADKSLNFPLHTLIFSEINMLSGTSTAMFF